MDPTKLYAVVEDLLDHVHAVSDAVLPPEYRFERVHVVNGPAVLDGVEECVEHLVAWPEALLPTTMFPEPSSRAILCAGSSTMVQVVVQSLRCEPILDPRGFPTSTERDAAARLVYVDAWAAWNAVTEWALAREAADGESAMLVTAGPVPPSRVAGWETRVNIEVDYCAPGPPHVPFPPGFFDPVPPRT